jgi:hypothetical protein
MRPLYLLLAASVALSGGCAPLIVGCGEDLASLKTKEEVHARLGEPAVRGVTDGLPFEEYHTRRKIAEEQRYGEMYGPFWLMTCGALDLPFVPYELCRAGWRTLAGQTVCVTYDAAGTVIGLELDGEPLSPRRLFRRHASQDAAPLEGQAPPATP